jgi:hypothetical protein
MNYTELKTALQDFTENGETSFVDHLPTFVKQAEQRVFNTVLFPAVRKNVEAALTPGLKFVAAPDDFLAVSSFAVIDGDGAYEFLLNKDVNFIRSAYPVPTDTGLPRFYAMFGPKSDNEKELTFIVGPTPDTSYGVELHYFYYPTSIVEAGNSWLGDNFDSVLLYGALVEACIFMKGEADLLAAYDTKFKEALAMAKRLGDGLERSDTYRSGEPRIPVT